ncbi:MAG: ABC transporter permease [Dehalococcoidia bacterium]|nr:ABC transporter permease [Dehalococcoidia bacterium]
MGRFLIQRASFALLTLMAATVIVFTVSRLTGDPRQFMIRPEGYGVTPEQYEELGRKLGLDKPLVVQYLKWLGQVAQGDFGKTVQTQRSVSEVIRERLPNTLQLAGAGWLLATLVGVPLGVMSAVKRGSVLDHAGRVFAILGQAVPGFWLGIMSVLIFSVHLGLLPTSTKGSPDASILQQLKYFVLPVVTLGWGGAAGYMRLTRSSMLDVLDSEYVKLARAKGVSTYKLIWKHAFRNALIPPITFSALLLAFFLNGQVIIETVFGWPGLGRLATESVFQNDYTTMTAAVLMFALLYSIASFAADLAYAVVDPRVRFT